MSLIHDGGLMSQTTNATPIVYAITMNVSPAEEQIIRDFRRLLSRKESGAMKIEVGNGRVTDYETTFDGDLKKLNSHLEPVPRPTGSVNGR
jgi:hypothetical protein